jgi:hypothetical protein
MFDYFKLNGDVHHIAHQEPPSPKQHFHSRPHSLRLIFVLALKTGVVAPQGLFARP